MSRTRTVQFVPETFEQLYEHYYDYVVNLVAQAGIDRQDAEDVAQTLLAIAYEKDFLSSFDPDYGRGDGTANFRTFLSGVLLKYLRHYLTRQRKNRTREPFSVDAPVTNGDGARGEGGFNDLSWMEYRGPSHVDYHDELEADSTIFTIRLHLMTVPPRNEQDKCDLVLLFDAIAKQTELDDKVDTMALAEQFGVSKTSIQNWMKRLRAEIHSVMEAQKQW